MTSMQGKTTKIVYVVSIMLLFSFLAACGDSAGTRLKKGAAVPPFKANDLNGRPVSLMNFKGHPVILRFFLTDCKFCRADTPGFNNYFKRHKDNGLKIVYINTNAADVAEVRDFAEELGIQFPVIFDPGGKIASAYNIRTQPMTIVLNPEHLLEAALLGVVSESSLEDLLTSYLN